MPNERFKPAITEQIKLKPRKTLLELLPDVFKKVLDESKTNKDFLNLKPNTVALTAKILDEVIKQLSIDWNVTVDEILEEFKLTKSLEEAIALYSVRKPELLKGFFIFKGTKVDIEYILRVSGYNMEIYDNQRLYRTPKEKLLNFEYNKDEDAFYYIGSTGAKKRVKNCELYAVINADLTNPNFQGYNTKTLETIKTIIVSRLLVCVYINRLGINFFIRDNYIYSIDEIVKIVKDLKYKDDYFSALHWDSKEKWDNAKQWDSKRVISDNMAVNRIMEFQETVLNKYQWDKPNTEWDTAKPWDASPIIIGEKMLSVKSIKKSLTDVYDINAGEVLQVVRYSRENKIIEHIEVKTNGN